MKNLWKQPSCILKLKSDTSTNKGLSKLILLSQRKKSKILNLLNYNNFPIGRLCETVKYNGYKSNTMSFFNLFNSPLLKLFIFFSIFLFFQELIPLSLNGHGKWKNILDISVNIYLRRLPFFFVLYMYK